MAAEACDAIGECKAALHESGESFARLDHTGKTDSIFGFSERRWRFYFPGPTERDRRGMRVGYRHISKPATRTSCFDISWVRQKIFAAIPEKYSNRRSVSQYRAALAESRQTIGAM